MDLTQKLAVWLKQKNSIVARLEDIKTRRAALDEEQRLLEVEVALLPPLEVAMVDELAVAQVEVDKEALPVPAVPVTPAEETP